MKNQPEEETHAARLWQAARERHAAGDELAAMALLTQALMENGELAEARLLRAEILYATGSQQEAEADADLLLGQPAPLPRAGLLKAALRLRQGDAETAIVYYNKVKEQFPQEGEAYVGLSRAYAALRQTGRALEVMDEAVERLPGYAGAYHERGRLRLLLNDKAGAMDDLRRALLADPQAAGMLEGRFTNIRQEQQPDGADPDGKGTDKRH